MSRILDPTAPPPATDPDPGPDVGTARGQDHRSALRPRLALVAVGHRRVGAAPRAPRARVSCSWEAGNRIGVDGEDTFSALGVFAADVDAALVGLGN